MARSTVELELVAVVSKAAKTVEDFTKTTQKSLSSISLNTTISAINDGFELVGKTAGRAFGAISSVISDAVSEAAEAEQSITNLTNALRLQNDFSQQAIEDFNEFAGSLQDISIFSDDAVINSLALAKQFRATNEEAKKVVSVAADLAAITGTDLDTATQKVAQTLNGFVDKSLAKAIPELKNLSKEALISGAALDVIGQRVQGSAEQLANTFTGSLIKAKNSFSDFLETIGGFITNNPVIIQGIKAISDTFKELNQTFKNNGTQITALITDGFIFLIESIPAVVSAIQFVDRVVSTTAVAFYTLGRSIGAVAAAVKLLTEGDFEGIKEINRLVTEENAAAFQQNRDRLKNFYEPIIQSADKLANRVREISENVKKTPVPTGKSLTGPDQRGDAFQKTPEQLRKEIEEASKNPIKAILDFGFTGKIDNQAGIAIGAGLVNGILKGAKGAQDFVASALGGLADTLLPGIGGVVSEIVGVLAQGPDKVRELIRGFVDALPEVISAIVQSVPVLIEELSNAIPVLVQKLVDQLPTIVQALAAAMPQVAISLGLQMPRVAISFVTSLIQNIPNIIAGFAEEFLKIPGQFVDALLDLLPFGLGGGGDGGGGIPIIGDIIGGIGDFVGGFFADGGRVPDRPEFRGDKFPARLDAGEQVLSRDLTDKLDSFLNNGGGGQPIEINLNIGLQQFAKIMLEADRLGYRVRA